MFEAKTGNPGRKVSSLSDGALELTADELNAVSGGDIRGVFQVSKNDSWVISSDGASFRVTHFHGASWQA
jgi:hypothetical protein